MRVIPVLDILNGEVVRGVAGRRDQYRRIQSQITSSAEPLAVARAFRDQFGLNELYIADLDAIISQRPNLYILQSLCEDGFQLSVDAGIRDVNDLKSLGIIGATSLIVGLESCRSPIDLGKIANIAPDVTFSLDLFAGQPRKAKDAKDWDEQPIGIVHQAVLAGANSILILDLCDVGMETGGSSDPICQIIHERYQSVQLIAGGGVRNKSDLTRLNQLGVNAVLVASALHDRKLNRSDINGFL